MTAAVRGNSNAIPRHFETLPPGFQYVALWPLLFCTRRGQFLTHPKIFVCICFSSAHNRVSFVGDRGGQFKKADTPPKLFVWRGTDTRCKMRPLCERKVDIACCCEARIQNRVDKRTFVISPTSTTINSSTLLSPLLTFCTCPIHPDGICVMLRLVAL